MSAVESKDIDTIRQLVGKTADVTSLEGGSATWSTLLKLAYKQGE